MSGVRQNARGHVLFRVPGHLSIGPYNELGHGITVRGQDRASWFPFDLMRPAAARTTGLHVLSLPVSSDAANQAGQEIWGLPKFVADVPFKLEGRHFLGSVTDPLDAKKSLFSIDCLLGRGPQTKGLDLVLFNERAQVKEKSVVNVACNFHTVRCPEFTLTIHQGEHQLQALLRRLALDVASPFVAQYTTRFVSDLQGPIPVMD